MVLEVNALSLDDLNSVLESFFALFQIVWNQVLLQVFREVGQFEQVTVAGQVSERQSVVQFLIFSVLFLHVLFDERLIESFHLLIKKPFIEKRGEGMQLQLERLRNVEKVEDKGLNHLYVGEALIINHQLYLKLNKPQSRFQKIFHKTDVYG